MKSTFATSIRGQRAAVWLGALSLSFAAGSGARAQSVFTNAITATDPSAANPFTTGQVVDPNLTVSGIGRGGGITASSASNRYSAANFAAAFDATDYFTFMLDANDGFDLDLTSFVYTGQRSNTGPTTFNFRSSRDNFTANLGAPTATGATIDLTAATFQNLTAPIEFRLYGFGNGATAGTFSVNDFTFNGIVAVPEPTTVAAGLLGVALLGWSQRRRLKGLVGPRLA